MLRRRYLRTCCKQRVHTTDCAGTKRKRMDHRALASCVSMYMAHGTRAPADCSRAARSRARGATVQGRQASTPHRLFPRRSRRCCLPGADHASRRWRRGMCAGGAHAATHGTFLASTSDAAVSCALLASTLERQAEICDVVLECGLNRFERRLKYSEDHATVVTALLIATPSAAVLASVALSAARLLLASSPPAAARAPP